MLMELNVVAIQFGELNTVFGIINFQYSDAHVSFGDHIILSGGFDSELNLVFLLIYRWLDI